MGFSFDSDKLHPVMISSDSPRMLFKILHLIKCRCTKRCGTNRCQCRKAGLICIDLCARGDDDEPCVNCPSEPSSDQEDDGEDDEEDTS